LARGQRPGAGALQQDARRQAPGAHPRAALLAHREVRSRGARALGVPLVAFSLYMPRPLRAALAIVVLLALAGATYQGVLTSLERRRYPHPGRLIDVGGHQLQIYCTGKG